MKVSMNLIVCLMLSFFTGGCLAARDFSGAGVSFCGAVGWLFLWLDEPFSNKTDTDEK